MNTEPVTTEPITTTANVIPGHCPYGLRLIKVMLLALALLFGACTEAVHHDLDERSANEVLFTLSLHGVSASKEAESEGRWTVVVPRTQVQRALSVMAAEGLPRRESDAMSLLADSGGLVPSPEEEQARHIALLTSELEATFLAMDGIVDAHVHAALPQTRRRPGDPEVAARASVLLVYSEASTPPTDDAIRAIMQGRIPQLEATDIAIVRSETTVHEVPDLAIVAVGPFAVTEESAGLLRAAIAGAGGIFALLASLLVFITLRKARQPSAE